MPEMRTCENPQCPNGGEFLVTPGTTAKRKYCDDSCRWKANNLREVAERAAVATGEVPAERVAQLEAEVIRAQDRARLANEERRRAEARITTRDRQILDLEAQIERLGLFRVETLDHSAPWMVPQKVLQKQRRGIPNLVVSDMHFDEVVDPAQVEGSNAYDREIAHQRMKTLFENTVKVTRDYTAGLKFEGISLMLAGDGLSGDIHEELSETNEKPMVASYLHWRRELEGWLLGFADEYGKVHVSGVPGNHPRTSRKPRAKFRAESNFDWLILEELAWTLRNDSRFTFQVPTSPDCIVQIYDTNHLLTHGDQFRGGSGIAGILSPLALGQHRKTRRQMSIGQALSLTLGENADAYRPVSYDFAWMVLGHFHQYFMGRGLAVNGSLKGYDEYAYTNNFDWEEPQQALWIVTPEHGAAFRAPIFVMNRAREGW